MYNREIVAIDGYAMMKRKKIDDNRRIYQEEMDIRERELRLKEKELELKEKALNAILNNNNNSHDVCESSIPLSTSDDILDDFTDEEIMKLRKMFNMIL